MSSIAAWTIIVILATIANIAAVLDGAPAKYVIIISCLILFGVQCIITQLLGVKISSAGMSFPRYPADWFTLASFGRKFVSKDSLSRIDLSDVGLTVYTKGGGYINIPVKDRNRAKNTLFLARKAYPSVQI